MVLVVLVLVVLVMLVLVVVPVVVVVPLLVMIGRWWCILNRTSRTARDDCRAARGIRQRQGEGLVGLPVGVAQDGDRDRLAGFAGSEGHGPAREGSSRKVAHIGRVRTRAGDREVDVGGSAVDGVGVAPAEHRKG